MNRERKKVGDEGRGDSISRHGAKVASGMKVKELCGLICLLLLNVFISAFPSLPFSFLLFLKHPSRFLSGISFSMIYFSPRTSSVSSSCFDVKSEAAIWPYKV